MWIALLPLALIWGMAARLRRKFYPDRWKYRSRLPVVCVGNLHSGGSGKTPLALEILKHFAPRQPILVSRGYRGSESRRGARLDRSAADGPRRYGDEPWMLSQLWAGPIFVGKKRAEVLRRIEAEFSKALVVLDDGFQHFALARDLDLALLQATRSPTDSFCLPLGGLREPLSALRGASAVVLVEGQHEAEWKNVLDQVAPSVPVFPARIQPSGIWEGHEKYDPGAQDTWGAFCGIGLPDGFRRTVAGIAGATFLEAFPDHEPYGAREVSRLWKARERLGLKHFLTTDKDWFKVREVLNQRGARVFSLRIRYEMPPEFWYFLETRLENL